MKYLIEQVAAGYSYNPVSWQDVAAYSLNQQSGQVGCMCMCNQWFSQAVTELKSLTVVQKQAMRNSGHNLETVTTPFTASDFPPKQPLLCCFLNRVPRPSGSPLCTVTPATHLHSKAAPNLPSAPWAPTTRQQQEVEVAVVPAQAAAWLHTSCSMVVVSRQMLLQPPQQL